MKCTLAIVRQWTGKVPDRRAGGTARAAAGAPLRSRAKTRYAEPQWTAYTSNPTQLRRAFHYNVDSGCLRLSFSYPAIFFCFSFQTVTV